MRFTATRRIRAAAFVAIALDLAHLNIVIVGDRAVIEEPLRKTGIAPIVLLDIEGKPVTSAQP